MDKSGRVEIFFQDENFFLESRILFSSREYFFFESRIFSWSRESCHRDDNFYLVSRLFLSSRELFLRVEFWQPVEIFFLESRFVCRVENFFIESRIPNMPCRQLPPKWSNNMAVCRSAAYVAFLFIVVVLQVTDGNVEELERFLLSMQDFISHIEQCTAPGDDRNMEYIYDLGFVERLCGNNRTFFLVFAKVQGFLEIKVLIDDL